MDLWFLELAWCLFLCRICDWSKWKRQKFGWNGERNDCRHAVDVLNPESSKNGRCWYCWTIESGRHGTTRKPTAFHETRITTAPTLKPTTTADDISEKAIPRNGSIALLEVENLSVDCICKYYTPPTLFLICSRWMCCLSCLSLDWVKQSWWQIPTRRVD